MLAASDGGHLGRQMSGSADSFTAAVCGGSSTEAWEGMTVPRAPRRSKLVAFAVAAGCVAVLGTGAGLYVAKLSGKHAEDRRSASIPPSGANTTYTPDNTTPDDCETSDVRCVEQAFANIAYRTDARHALIALQSTADHSKEIRQYCHRITHAVGRGALTRLEGRGGAAFAEGMSTCGSGYYHGIAESSLGALKPYPDTLGQRAVTLCRDATISATRHQSIMCVHGVGHGIMLATRYDLLTSLQACEEFANDLNRENCTNGVFMEGFTSSYGLRSRWADQQDRFYPCTFVATRYQRMCYRLITIRFLSQKGLDWPKVARICHSAPTPWPQECMYSLGRDAAGLTHFNGKQTERVCRHAKDHYARCIQGAVEVFTNELPDGIGAQRLCELVATRLRGFCYDHASFMIVLRGRTAAERQRLCAPLTSTVYRALCRAQARNPSPPDPSITGGKRTEVS